MRRSSPERGVAVVMRDSVHEIEARVWKMHAHSPYLPTVFVVPSHLLGTSLAQGLTPASRAGWSSAGACWGDPPPC